MSTTDDDCLRLTRELSDPDREVRLRGLNEIDIVGICSGGYDWAVPEVARLLAEEADEEVRKLAVAAIRDTGFQNDAASRAILGLLHDPRPRVRRDALWSMFLHCGWHGRDYVILQVFPRLVCLLGDPDTEVQFVAAFLLTEPALNRSRAYHEANGGSLATARAGLHSANLSDLLRSLVVLPEYEEFDATPWLDDSRPSVRLAVTLSYRLAGWQPDRVEEARDTRFALQVGRVPAEPYPERAVPEYAIAGLSRLLADPAPEVRQIAAVCCESIRDPRLVPALTQALHDPSGDVLWRVFWALEKFKNLPFRTLQVVVALLPCYEPKLFERACNVLAFTESDVAFALPTLCSFLDDPERGDGIASVIGHITPPDLAAQVFARLLMHLADDPAGTSWQLKGALERLLPHVVADPAPFAHLFRPEATAAACLAELMPLVPVPT
jgi:hypothetical protein